VERERAGGGEFDAKRFTSKEKDSKEIHLKLSLQSQIKSSHVTISFHKKLKPFKVGQGGARPQTLDPKP